MFFIYMSPIYFFISEIYRFNSGVYWLIFYCFIVGLDNSLYWLFTCGINCLINWLYVRPSRIFIKYLMFSSRQYEKVDILVVELAVTVARKSVWFILQSTSNKEDKSVVFYELFNVKIKTRTEINLKLMLYVI